MFEQMKGLTPKKKIEYYIQYYGIVTVVILLVIFAIAMWIKTAVTDKTDIANIMLINADDSNVYEKEELQAYFKEVLLEYDFNPKKDEIVISTGYHMGAAFDVQTDTTNLMRLQTELSAGAGDILIFNEDYSEQMLNFGAMRDLHDLLDASYLKEHEDDLLYYYDEEEKKSYPVAIRVNPNSKLMKILDVYHDCDAYIGICYRTLSDEQTVCKTVLHDALEE